MTGPPQAIVRVGYYSPQDGLECIWLVNEDGEYCETVDKKYLEKHYQAISVSEERDYYGENRPAIKRLSEKEKRKLQQGL